MKKIYILLLFAVLFGFVGMKEAKATCPDGWFEHWNESWETECFAEPCQGQ